jgi:four helix bundle protein
MAKTIAEEMAEKTYRELAKPKQPEARSRVWKDPEGYKYLVPWSNAVLLRFLVRLLTEGLPKSEYRRKAQIDDAARSVVRNVEEGYKRSTTSEYLQFIGYSQGSLEEVKGDIREMTEDGFLRTIRGSSLEGIGLDLGNFHQALRGDKGHKGNLKDSKETETVVGGPQALRGDKGRHRRLEDGKRTEGRADSGHRALKGDKGHLKDSKETETVVGGHEASKGDKGNLKDGRVPSSKNPLNSSKPNRKPWEYRPLTTLYPPLGKVRAEDLTYEVFLELINKTDWNFRKLVESLEKKLADGQMWWKVEHARIASNLKPR